MRYEDAYQSGSMSNENPVARDDGDALAAGSRGPATGNVISGVGTQTGKLGADVSNGDASITSISGAGGSDATLSGGKLSVAGEFGKLSVDAQGNYSYLANQGAPENSRDQFTYKLADSQGNSDTATLTIEIGKSQAVVQTNAEQIVVGPDGVVILPPGVELSDIMVVDRNLVITMPDGTQRVIVDGAVFVPQLVLGDVEVPATNLAALLIDSEPRPAAGSQLAGGQPQSGGGNFAVPVSPLDPGIPLGNLIPPTELAYQPPEFKEVGIEEERPDAIPTIVIETLDQPVGVENATAVVNENALPARGAEPAGSNSVSTSESTTGTMIYSSEDTPNTLTINGIVVTSVGQVIQGNFGAITITSMVGGEIGYSYTLVDNTSGNDTQDLFTVVITDDDGDTDTATLTIAIVDDVPNAIDDVVAGIQPEGAAVTINVFANDVPGADGVDIDNSPGVTVSLVAGWLTGTGTLVYNNNGTFSYTPAAGEQGAISFRYQIVDGDGDSDTALVTFTLAPDPGVTALDVTAKVDDDGLSGGNAASTLGDDDQNAGEPGATASEATWTGSVAITAVDGPASYSFAGMGTGAAVRAWRGRT